MLDLVTISTILERLNEIKNDTKTDKRNGICYNLYYYTHATGRDESTDLDQTDDVDDWLEYQFAQWPECHIKEDGSKDVHYPVGGEEEFCKCHLFDNPRRIKLLDFLIKQATNQLNVIEGQS